MTDSRRSFFAYAGWDGVGVEVTGMSEEAASASTVIVAIGAVVGIILIADALADKVLSWQD